ncbi:hypothetical protein [Devosia sp. FJ2-5-3]|uniref:hypothetical protein n=1 Tax=Devosia sp. FJ2-5-3 TaxID=2976680 RepID=UPI0023D85E63|nr:hypothetical protein [Devosia sp. FJ2-5-3]WEJ60191.1 hypothetical protein N0P34_09215 [Devosia sp. FJ2-5-3]
MLRLIADAEGAYCPAADLDPTAVRALHELVKAKRLTVEPNDGAPPRYVLTAQGWEDAQ